MLLIQSKLIDIKTRNCFGIICTSSKAEDCRVPLSLDKARELNIQDIDIIEYLGVQEDEVVRHTRYSDRYGRLENSISFIDSYEDVPYEKMGSVEDVLNYQEVIWGYVFPYLNFIKLDSEEAIKRVLELDNQ